MNYELLLLLLSIQLNLPHVKKMMMVVMDVEYCVIVFLFALFFILLSILSTLIHSFEFLIENLILQFSLVDSFRYLKSRGI